MQGGRRVTDRTTYYQRKNRHALTNGGVFRCPGCIGVVEHLPATDTYCCGPCAYVWDRNGDPIKTKEA
jgi:hypothetical protein